MRARITEVVHRLARHHVDEYADLFEPWWVYDTPLVIDGATVKATHMNDVIRFEAPADAGASVVGGA